MEYTVTIKCADTIELLNFMNILSSNVGSAFAPPKDLLTEEAAPSASQVDGVTVLSPSPSGENAKADTSASVVAAVEAHSTPKKRAKKEKEEAPPVVVEKPLVFDIETDIIPAFQRYAKAVSREAAAKVIEEYNVKSVRELPADKFPEILAKLRC